MFYLRRIPYTLPSSLHEESRVFCQMQAGVDGETDEHAACMTEKKRCMTISEDVPARLRRDYSMDRSATKKQ